MEGPVATGAAPNGDSRRLRRGSAAVFMLKVLGAGVGFGAQVFLARIMLPAEFGVYVLAFAVASGLMMFASAGVPFSAIRFVPVYATKQRWDLLRGFLSTATMLTLAGSFLVALAFAAGVVGFRLAIGPDSGDGIWPALLLAALLVMPLAGVQILGAVLQALRRARVAEFYTSVVRPALVVALLAPMILLATTGEGDGDRLLVPAETAVLATVAATGIVLITMLAAVWRALPPELAGVRPERLWRRWLTSGLMLLLVLSGPALNAYIDVLAIGFFHGPEPAGIYGVAARNAQLPALAIAAVNALLGPMLAEHYAAKDYSRLQTSAALGAWVALGLALPAAIGLWALGPLILKLFGPGFVSGYTAMCVLTAAQLMVAAAGAAGALGVLAGRESVVAGIMLGGVACNLALNAVLVPTFGMVGAAWSTLAALAVSHGGLLVWCHRALDLNPSITGRPLWRS